MRITQKFAALILCLLVTGYAHAIGTLIPALDRVDMVHDFKRNLIYISNGSQVLRYDVGAGVMLAPIDVGGLLYGMDISPDGNTLAVADVVRSDTQVWVHTIDLESNAVNDVFFPRAFYEGGTFTVAYGSDGALLVTSEFEGSGWVPLRRYDQLTDTTTTLASVRQNTMIVGSGDLDTIALAESNSSAGPFGKYDVVNQLVSSGPGTGWFNYEIGVNHNGTQFSVPTYGGTFVYDENFSEIAVVGVYASAQPVGVVYHPAEDIVYYAWRDSSQVRAYDTNTLSQTAAYDFEYIFQHNGNYAFVNGRLKTAADGSMILATVDGGVRFVQLYNGLTANGLSIVTDENVPVSITLDASVGNNGDISYRIAQNPLHGSISGSPPAIVYTPDADYFGNDSFEYIAHYGRADARATVDITVNPGNSEPIAVDDFVDLTQKKILIPVLANDSDPDGDALTIIDVTAPTYGRAYIVDGGQQIYYRARRGSISSDSFVYTIDDGHGATASATVTVKYSN